MFQIFLVSLRGIFRDRVFHGIILVAVAYLVIPSISSLSMRQVTELSTTLSLSLLTFILLLLSVFLGGTSLWRDLERRYTYSVAGLPISRSGYLFGKFLAVAVFLLLVSLLLGVMTAGTVYLSSSLYPPVQAVAWGNLGLAIFFNCFKYILLVGCSFLFSSVSTSFFLPIFGTLSVFLVGTATQQVYDFIQTPAGQQLPLLIRRVAAGLYYVLPNFAAFDFNLNAIYGLAIPTTGLVLTALYFLIYTGLLLALACTIFERREL